MIYSSLTHEIVVDGAADIVFRICERVDKWPEFMPAVKQACFLNRYEGGDEVQITASVNEQVWTWQSKRVIDIGDRRISFERVNPPEHISYFKGAWQIFETRHNSCGLTLTHEFELNNDDRQAFDFLVTSIKRNSSCDLNAIKQRAITSDA